MPRPRQAQGRPGTRVIPVGWAEHHAVVAGKTHGAECSIRHPGAGTKGPVDPSTGNRTITPGAAYFAGPCTVTYLRADARPGSSGEETLPTSRIEVALGRDDAAEAHTGDLVTFTSAGSDGDQTLVGTVLVVEAVDRDSVTWERVLTCSENQS